jgi:methionyl-tRNA formyltransferase
MKIGFFGGGQQAHCALVALVNDPEFEIIFIHPRDPEEKLITDFAVENDVQILAVTQINTIESLNLIQDFQIDLILSINCKEIFKADLLEIPRLGAINMHNGMLPRQRGGGGAYVGMINNETCGTTVHFISEGIDDGNIISQYPIKMTENMTMGELQEKIREVTPNLITSALNKVQVAEYIGKPQKDDNFYYVPAKPEWDELIDWTLSTNEILDRIRARFPGPKSFFLYGGEIFFVKDVTREPKLLSHVNVPGQVLARSREKGVLVKTRDTGLWITRVRKNETENDMIADFPIGSMFCQNVHKKLFDLESRLSKIECVLIEKTSDD